MVGAVMMNMEMKMAVHNNNHSNFESLSENHSMDIQSLSSSSSASESEPRNHLDQNIGCQTQDDYSDITTKSTTTSTRTIMNVNMNVGHHERSHDRSAKFVGKHSQTHSQSHNVNVPLTPLSIIPMNMNTDGEHDFKDDSRSGRRAAHEPMTTNTTSRTSQDHEDDDESSRCSSSMYSHDQFGSADEGYGSVSSMHSCSHDFLGGEGRDMDGDTHMRTPYYEPRQQQQLRKSFTVTIPMDIDVGNDHEYENDTTIRKRKQDQLHHKQSSDLEEKKLRSGTPTYDTKLSTAEKPIVVRIPSNLALDCLGQDDASVDGDVSVTSVTEIDASSIVIVPVSPVPQTKKHPELSPIPFQLDQHGYDPRIYATPPQDLALSVRPAPSQTIRNELGLQLLKMDQRQVQPSSFLPPIELSFRPNLKTAASDDMNISQTLSEGDMNLESTATPLKLKQLSAKFSQITDNARSCALPYPHSPIPACRDLIRRTSESKQGQRVRAAISAQNDIMQHKIQLQRDRFEKYKAERAVRKALRMEKRRKLKEEKEKRRSRIIVIPSNHRLKLLWDTLTVLLTFVSAYVGHIYIRDRSTYEWDWFVLFTNTWFFIDVVLNFFTDHRTGDGKLLQNGREVWGRYLTTWFAIDALSLLPWERMFLRPIIQKQKRRNIVVKWFFRSKAVVKVTRILKGRHIKAFGKLANNTKRIGVNSKRLLQLIIKYVPKYVLFYRNMKGVLVLKTLRQIHFIKKIFRGLTSKPHDEEDDIDDDEDEDEDEEFEEGDDIQSFSHALAHYGGIGDKDIDDDDIPEADFRSCLGDGDHDHEHDLDMQDGTHTHMGNMHHAIQIPDTGFYRAQSA